MTASSSPRFALLDDSYPEETRRNLGPLTAARLTANACFRYASPFLASISDDLDVSLGRLGVAIRITEISVGIASLAGSRVDRLRRRTSMVMGLSGVSIGTVIAASSQNVPMFALGLVILAVFKMMFDMGLAGWVNDRVDYDRRGRVVGITETSWALGLLVGVSGMGLVASTTSWRWGYLTGAAAVGLMALMVAVRTHDPDQKRSPKPEVVSGRMAPGGSLVILTTFFLMAASQSMFVTFGSWLDDEFGFSDAGIAAVAFGLGAFELLASLGSSRRSDVWGKERSTVIGALLIAPSGVLLALVNGHVGIGLVLLGIYMLGFEFAFVSTIPLATNLVPGSPGRGLGLSYTGGMLARAAMSVAATSAYERWGMTAPAAMGAACSIGVIGCITVYQRRSLSRDSRS